MSSTNHRLKCPGCGANYLYSSDKIDESNSVECQNCTMRFSTQMGSEGISSIPLDDTDVIKPSIHFLSETVEGVRIKCPNCGSKYIYTDEHKLQDGRVNCQNCGSAIDYVGEDVFLVKEPGPARTESQDIMLCVIIIIFILFVPLIIAIPVILCTLVWNEMQTREPSDLDTKVVRRDTEEPGPW